MNLRALAGYMDSMRASMAWTANASGGGRDVRLPARLRSGPSEMDIKDKCERTRGTLRKFHPSVEAGLIRCVVPGRRDYTFWTAGGGQERMHRFPSLGKNAARLP
jgi:hypothetical protein